MEFRTWKDYYRFIQKYANASCINCYYTGKAKDSDDDNDYKRTFCTRHISMVEFAFQFLCTEWVHENTGKSLNEYGDCPVWKVDLDIFDDDEIYSFEEASEVIRYNEELEE